MTDWRECLVVRDRENTLWGRDPWTTDDPHQRRWIAVGSAGLGADGCYEDEIERRFGPITPVLDADGLPVVHTVGDLTARHQLARPRIRVAGREGKLKIVKPSDAYPGTVTLIWGDCWEDAALEEPCEVLA